MMQRAVIVAGEPSGDLLAARVMQGLRVRTGSALQLAGIGGPAMQSQGLQAWHPMDALSVFGYADALRQAPRLIHTWRNTRRRTLAIQPDVFVGVDAPDFNLRLEEQLRARGIPTVHFVGPSIWAWRYQRIHQIRRAVSRMLVLFPFEVDIYHKEGVPVTYVGHPLAEMIPENPDRSRARAFLKVPAGTRVLALLPGSRESEIRLLAPRFLQAVRQLQAQDPDLHVLIPAVNQARKEQLVSALAHCPVSHCTVLAPQASEPRHDDDAPEQDALDGTDADRSRWPVAWHALEAADAVLVASGTATLETALFKRPMVISYVLSPWMRRIMAWKSGQDAPSLPWVGLPNILLQDSVVPELLQEAATPQALAEQTWASLTDPARAFRIEQKFTQLHADLWRDTPGLAADAILQTCHGQ